MSGTVSLRITLRYKDVEEFSSRYAENISSAGLFLRTRTPKPTGTRIRFELLLVDGVRALAGEGVVVAVRNDDKPGMSIRFHQIEADSQPVIDRIVAAHGEGALAPTPLGGAFGRPAGSSFQSAWKAPGGWSASVPPGVRVSAPPETSGRRRASNVVKPWDVGSQAATSTEIVRARSPLSTPPDASPWAPAGARMDVPEPQPSRTHDAPTARIAVDEPATARIPIDQAVAAARASDLPFRRGAQETEELAPSPLPAATDAVALAAAPEVLGGVGSGLLTESRDIVGPAEISTDDLPGRSAGPRRVTQELGFADALPTSAAVRDSLVAAARVDTSHGQAEGVEPRGPDADPLSREQQAMGFEPAHAQEPTAIDPPQLGLPRGEDAPVAMAPRSIEIEGAAPFVLEPAAPLEIPEMVADTPALMTPSDEALTELPDVQQARLSQEVARDTGRISVSAEDRGATARVDVMPWRDEPIPSAVEVDLGSAIVPAESVEVDLGSMVMPAVPMEAPAASGPAPEGVPARETKGWTDEETETGALSPRSSGAAARPAPAWTDEETETAFPAPGHVSIGVSLRDRSDEAEAPEVIPTAALDATEEAPASDAEDQPRPTHADDAGDVADAREAEAPAIAREDAEPSREAASLDDARASDEPLLESEPRDASAGGAADSAARAPEAHDEEAHDARSAPEHVEAPHAAEIPRFQALNEATRDAAEPARAASSEGTAPSTAHDPTPAAPAAPPDPPAGREEAPTPVQAREVSAEEAVTLLPTPPLAEGSWASALGIAQSDPPALPGSVAGSGPRSKPLGRTTSTQRIDLSRHLAVEVREIDDGDAVVGAPSGSAVIDPAFESDLRDHDRAAADAAAAPAETARPEPIDPPHAASGTVDLVERVEGADLSDLARAELSRTSDPAPAAPEELLGNPSHGRAARTGELVAENTIRLDVGARDTARDAPATTRIAVDPELAAEPELPPPPAEMELPPPSAQHELAVEQSTVRVEARGLDGLDDPTGRVPVIVGVRASSTPPPARRGSSVASAPPDPARISVTPLEAGAAQGTAIRPSRPSDAMALDSISSPDTAPPRTLGIDVMSAAVRMGAIERGRFEPIKVGEGTSVPGLVVLRADGSLVAGEEAVSAAEASVRVRELLLALAGAASDVVVEPREGRAATRLGRELVEVSEILRVFFAQFGQAVARDRTRVLIAVPAPLNTDAEALLVRSAKAGGLEVTEVVPFGVAASRAFGLDAMAIESALVVDVGATHLGVSVLRRARDGLRTAVVRSYASPSVADLDRPLLALAIEEARRAHPALTIDGNVERALSNGLARVRSEIKKETWVELKVRGAVGELPVRMSRPKVVQVTEQVVARVAQAVREALGEAGVHPRALGALLIVGPGASFGPIGQALTALTTLEPLAGLEPDEVVLMGLVRAAGDRASRERVTRADVLEQDIGIGLPGGRFHPLFTSGTKLPARLTRKHATIRDGQTELELALYEGRGDTVGKCTPLTTAVLHGLPKAARGQVNVDVELELDADAVLTVDLTEPKSSLKKRAVIPTSQTPIARRKEIEARPPIEDPSGAKPKPKVGLLGRLLGRG